MAKVLAPYCGLTAAAIVAKATAGFSTLAVNGSNVDVTKISLKGFADIIGEAPYYLEAVCKSAGVNAYSGFSPREWYITSSTVTSRPKTPYSMGNFAGYNHNAVTPSITCNNPINLDSTHAGDAYNISLDLILGEVDWATQLGLDDCIIKVNGSVLTSFALSTYTANTTKNVLASVTCPGEGLSSSFAIQVWFGTGVTANGRLVAASASTTINVANAARFANVLVDDIQDNRDVLDSIGSPYVNSGEYTHLLEATSSSKTMSASSLAGKYVMTAQIYDGGGYKRTLGTALYNFPDKLIRTDVYMYRVRSAVKSSEYQVANNIWVEYTDTTGISFTYDLPAGLNIPYDEDLYYIIFRSWY